MSEVSGKLLSVMLFAKNKNVIYLLNFFGQKVDEASKSDRQTLIFAETQYAFPFAYSLLIILNSNLSFFLFRLHFACFNISFALNLLFRVPQGRSR